MPDRASHQHRVTGALLITMGGIFSTKPAYCTRRHGVTQDVALIDDEFDLFDSRLEVHYTAGDNSTISNEDRILEILQEGAITGDDRFALRIEAFLLKLAYTNDKVLSLSNSRTQILAHQIESTHRIINSLNPRYLLADEVGLGKTIEAGLVIKELIFRHGYKRILIVCPASLCMQWQNEMENKFNERFVVMDRREFKKNRREKSTKNSNPWNLLDKVICSLDFIKSESHIENLKRTKWDVIIFDESHRLRRDSLKSTLAYNVAEILSVNTNALLLLSATPFRGKLEELYFLVRLLDKNLLGPFQTFFNTYCLNNTDLSTLRSKLSEVIIRRTKTDVGGFTKRHARTIRFELYTDERLLYDETTRYVVEEFNRAMQSENRAVGFVMTVFQKLLDSSSFALSSALKNRKQHLSALIESGNTDLLKQSALGKNIAWDEIEAEEDENADTMVNEILKKTYREIREEIAVLEYLIHIADAITLNKKGEKLVEIIRRLKKNNVKKVLIFTQFRTTQEYLQGILSEFSVELFNGSMDKNQKENAIQNFKDRADILISTEAGGEGRNLQFCNVLINYDLPWSPLKIEQRIGRIHRFGQPKDVYVYNFSTADTVAERVLEVLTRKLKLFEESIGTPDIMLGQIEEELNLNSIFMDIASKRKSIRKINAEIDARVETARRSYEKLNDLAIASRLDFNYDEYYKTTMNERKISNKRIESFISRLRDNSEFINEYIGKKNALTRLYPVKKYPDGSSPKKRHGTFDSARALDNENLEFLAFGNPIVDHLISECQGSSFGGETGIQYINYHKPFYGFVSYYIITFHSSSSHQELVPVCVPVSRQLTGEECADIEKLVIEQRFNKTAQSRTAAAAIRQVTSNIEEHIESSRQKIFDKAEKRAAEIKRDMENPVTMEIDKITTSYDQRIKEFEEQLERQVCQMKWFDKDMKSAITRTKNKIAREKREKMLSLSRQERFSDVVYTIEMLGAGILISLNSK